MQFILRTIAIFVAVAVAACCARNCAAQYDDKAHSTNTGTPYYHYFSWCILSGD